MLSVFSSFITFFIIIIIIIITTIIINYIILLVSRSFTNGLLFYIIHFNHQILT